jgi:hypothetical protein
MGITFLELKRQNMTVRLKDHNFEIFRGIIMSRCWISSQKHTDTCGR